MNKLVPISQQDLTQQFISVNKNLYYGHDRVKKLRGNLALPSYVHGYSLGIEYMYSWFKNKFTSQFGENFFKGGIYIDGKNVLDDYKRLNALDSKNIIKAENPRARIGIEVEYDYDREGVDLYQAPPEVFLKRSPYQEAFFKDYDHDLFLAMTPRAMRMNLAYKVRVNTRSQQLDIANFMELNFRSGATQAEYISVDFHVPKYIILDIAYKAGFKVVDGEVVDILDFIHYLNLHSELPFLFKLRAINRKFEYFIRVNNLYTHIATRDKIQRDSGERDGKLDFNFGIEMNAILTMPIPHYYAYYSSEVLTKEIAVDKLGEDMIPIYSINLFDIPKMDEHGWVQVAATSYQADKGDTTMDISPLFQGNSMLAKAIRHDLAVGISPSKYMNIMVFRDDDLAKQVDFKFDWVDKQIVLERPTAEERFTISIYTDRAYLNRLETSMNELDKYNNRVAHED